MAFLGSIGKFVGNLAKPVIAAAPAVVAGFASGGKAGAAQALLGSVTQHNVPLAPFGPGAGQIFSGVQTTFGGPTHFPSGFNGSSMPQAIPVGTGGVPAIPTRDIFDAIMKLAARLGVQIRTPSAVARIGRSILSKLLRFARANPGLTIVSLLANLGLNAIEANTLITWFTTHGKRRRRIKVTNVKALNRSVRRLEGFRRLSMRVEAALARRGVSRGIRRSRRCPKCRKNPCCC